MTEKLYYKDQYIKEFTAEILSCEKGERGFEVILDKTAFFPEGGGQPGDTGFIGGAEVIDTIESGDDVIHICTSEVSGQVECSLDFDKRFANMQQHTGEHIISGFIHAMTGFDNVGFHMGEHSITVDFNGVVTREQLEEAERLSNEAVYKNLPVKALYPTDEELADYDYRSKKEIKGQVRLTSIEGVDLCACCGTHVAYTGEIGIIKAVSMMNYKQGVRITLQIGRKAFEDYCEKNKNVLRISNLLKAKPEEVADAVERVQAQMQEQKFRYNQLKRNYYELVAEDCEGDKCCFFDDSGSADDARMLCDILADKAFVAAVFSGNDEIGYKYAVASRTYDVRKVAKELNSCCAGRGGGTPQMVQGSLATYRDMIECCWREIELNDD